MTTSARLTIFEGCDGSGKTTAARAYARATGARYVHLGPFPRVTTGLARLYVEAMLPALLGYQDVVMDRCWMSEAPYGAVFRGGQDRVGPLGRRMLERLALRCGAVVVLCDPGWDLVLRSFRARRGAEMLESEAQLRAVYSAYGRCGTHLPSARHDYGLGPVELLRVEQSRDPCHPLGRATAGRWDAPTVLVGQDFAEVKNDDALYQWPFASFGRDGCSPWLTAELEAAGIGERGLLWMNADQLDPGRLTEPTVDRIVTLGAKAELAVPVQLGHKVFRTWHPQGWKRFRPHGPYPLIKLLKELQP